MGESMLDELKKEDDKGAEALRDDLSTISCFAAIKIEMLMFNQNPPLDDVEELVKKIDKWIPKVEKAEAPKSLFDYNTVLAMTNALPTAEEPDGFQVAVIKGAREMMQLLAKIAQAPAQFQTPDGIEQLRGARNFCSRLSRSVQAMVDPPDLEQSLRDTMSAEATKRIC